MQFARWKNRFREKLFLYSHSMCLPKKLHGGHKVFFLRKTFFLLFTTWGEPWPQRDVCVRECECVSVRRGRGSARHLFAFSPPALEASCSLGVVFYVFSALFIFRVEVTHEARSALRRASIYYLSSVIFFALLLPPVFLRFFFASLLLWMAAQNIFVERN